MSSRILVVLGLTLLATLIGLIVNEIPRENQFDFSQKFLYKPESKGFSSEERIRLFKEWCKTYTKRYSALEFAYRFSIWNNSFEFVKETNSRNLSYQLEVNKFADLSSEEFSALYLGFNRVSDSSRSEKIVFLDEIGVPDSIDWREKGAVTEVKDQEQCGSCYSFSAIAALESIYFLKSGELLNFSQQQIIDCSREYGNAGCMGGFITYALSYTRDHGVELNSSYPYVGVTGTCKYDSTRVVYKNSDYRNVPSNDYNQLKAAVGMQPVSVGVQANEDAFQLYKSGILSSDCGTSINHAIIIVGYATSSDQQDYWIAKNSWGASWGMKGYINIARGTQNEGAGVCGINMEASYPLQ